MATNALLELKGAKTALNTTEGFKDVLHIARQTRPKLYDFWARRHLAEKLKEMGVRSDLYIMQSNGGVITAETACEESARTVLSGPAGGALAGVFVCKQTGMDNTITSVA